MYKIAFPNQERKDWTIPEEEKYYEEEGVADMFFHDVVWPLCRLSRFGIYVYEEWNG